MDVVYFVKDAKENPELVYSVRSVEKNFPHDKIVFVGGCPDGLTPDVHIKVKQTGATKYARVRGLIEAAIDSPEISDSFYLFNDDFFIISPVYAVYPMTDGTLWHKVSRLKAKYGKPTVYSDRLLNTARALRDTGYDRLNYELHVPMIISKDKAREVLADYPDTVAFRSAYGNHFCNAGAMMHPDVKIMDIEGKPDPDIHNVYLSTSDKSFKDGLVGKRIRGKFRKKSTYEEGA